MITDKVCFKMMRCAEFQLHACLPIVKRSVRSSDVFNHVLTIVDFDFAFEFSFDY